MTAHSRIRPARLPAPSLAAVTGPPPRVVVARRVIVTGSREFADAAAVSAALDVQHRTAQVAGAVLVVVHGACRTGADAHADRWAARHAGRGVRVERWPADWTTHGRAAGPRRNAAMVAAGADLVLAFPEPGAANAGTRSCVRAAHAAGLPVQLPAAVPVARED